MMTYIIFIISFLFFRTSSGVVWNAGGLSSNSLCFLKTDNTTQMGCISGNIGGLIGAYETSKSSTDERTSAYRTGYGYGYGYGYGRAYLSSDSTLGQNAYAFMSTFLDDWKQIQINIQLYIYYKPMFYMIKITGQ
jgi:hypothetical protein